MTTASRRPRCAAIMGATLAATLATIGLATTPAAQAAPELSGSRSVFLHARDGSRLAIGSLLLVPIDNGRSRFELRLDSGRFKDFFLSMREFKCLEGSGEILCHVPYPYPQPGSIGANDLAWLEHALLFMFKTPGEFGAKLWNGIYFALRPTDQGWEGRPQAVDLNHIAAPPAAPGVPPFRPALRDDIAPAARWFNRLSIE